MIIHWTIAAVVTVILLSLWTKIGIKDIPSHRSSHANVIPTAAGMCISLVFIIFYMFSKVFEPTSIEFIFGLSVLTILGFIDDWRELSYKIRLIGHVLSVGIILFMNDLSSVEYITWFFIGVGLINVCNFLDGLNGLLASQWLLTVGFLLAGFASINSIFWILWVSVLIYLFFNFPKARLFMGDTGSTILGFSYFVVIFYMTPLQKVFPTILLPHDSFILFSLFPLAFAWCDVTFTLTKRFVERRSIVNSFADYGFHHQARYFKSHGFVTIGYLGLNCLLTFGVQASFLNHQLIPIILSIYIALQLAHLFFIYKISKK